MVDVVDYITKTLAVAFINLLLFDILECRDGMLTMQCFMFVVIIDYVIYSLLNTAAKFQMEH